MDDLIVWPSKKVIELITLEYDLLEQLPDGVVIFDVVASSIVFQGYPDIAAASMLWLPPVIAGSNIQQKVRNGIPGNVYNIQFDIRLSDGQQWFKTFRLAITPNNTPAVPITIPLFFTSRPYPYNYQENITGSSTMINGSFLFAPNPMEDLRGSISMLFGGLSNGLTTYNYNYEDLMGSLAMMSGSVDPGLMVYNYQFEDLTGSISMRNGTIAVILVTYTYSYEDLLGSMTMISGTLV